MVTPTAPPQPSAVAGGQARSIPIDSIVAIDRLRPLDNEKVAGLAQSIQEVGLLQPIKVRHLPDGYRLIFGYHRLEAAKRAGLTQIPAIVAETDDTTALTEEIDENLIRFDLSVLSQAEHLLRNKEIYETLYPESTKSGRRGKNVGTVPAFSKYAAGKTGKDESTIRQYIRIASRLTDEVRDLLRPTALSNQTRQLDQLSRCTNPGVQLEIAKVLVSGEAKTVSAARRRLEGDIQTASGPTSVSETDGHEPASSLDESGTAAHGQARGINGFSRDEQKLPPPAATTPSLQDYIDHTLRALIWNDLTPAQFIATMARLARPNDTLDSLWSSYGESPVDGRRFMTAEDLQEADDFVKHPPEGMISTQLDAWMRDHNVPWHRDSINPAIRIWDAFGVPDPTTPLHMQLTSSPPSSVTADEVTPQSQASSCTTVQLDTPSEAFIDWAKEEWARRLPDADPLLKRDIRDAWAATGGNETYTRDAITVLIESAATKEVKVPGKYLLGILERNGPEDVAEQAEVIHRKRRQAEEKQTEQERRDRAYQEYVASQERGTAKLARLLQMKEDWRRRLEESGHTFDDEPTGDESTDG